MKSNERFVYLSNSESERNEKREGIIPSPPSFLARVVAATLFMRFFDFHASYE